MPAWGIEIWRSAVIATVTAGLKWAPEATVSAWISMNSANVWTRPIAVKSTNGAGFWAVGATTNSEAASVMKRTSAKVPAKSAM